MELRSECLYASRIEVGGSLDCSQKKNNNAAPLSYWALMKSSGGRDVLFVLQLLNNRLWCCSTRLAGSMVMTSHWWSFPRTTACGLTFTLNQHSVWKFLNNIHTQFQDAKQHAKVLNLRHNGHGRATAAGHLAREENGKRMASGGHVPNFKTKHIYKQK